MARPMRFFWYVDVASSVKAAISRAAKAQVGVGCRNRGAGPYAFCFGILSMG